MESKPEPRFCVTCRHCVMPPNDQHGNALPWICTRPILREDVVRGRRFESAGEQCSTERAEKGGFDDRPRCGPEGQFWAPMTVFERNREAVLAIALVIMAGAAFLALKFG